MKYNPVIDGLRALAVLLVIAYHTRLDIFSGYYIGVDIFFVVSGYLITVLLMKNEKLSFIDTLNFYEKRVRKLMPPLILVIFTSLPLAYYVMLPGQLIDFLESIYSSFLFYSNILFWQETGYFEPNTMFKPLIHTWSLALEMQFYFLLPLLLIFLNIENLKKYRLLILTIICLISLFYAQWASVNHPTSNYYLLQSRLWEFLIGSAGYFFSKSRFFFRVQRFKNLISIFSLVIIFISIPLFSKIYDMPSLFGIFLIIATVFIILFADKSTNVGNILSLRPLVFIGTLSYFLFLWHQPIFAFTRYLFSNNLNFFHYFILFLISLIFSYLSKLFFEKCFNINLIQKKLFYNYLISASIIILSFTSILYIYKGVPSRFDLPSAQITRTYDEYVQFVTKHSNTYLNKQFSSKENNVLIIGDSFARDIINSIYSNSDIKHLNLSYIYVERKCVAEILLINKISSSCTKYTESKKNLKLLSKSANEIWLAAKWDINSTNGTKKALSLSPYIFNKKIIVFGSKSFGKVDAYSLLKTPLNERNKSIYQLSENDLLILDRWKEDGDNYNFINLHEIFCPSNICNLFNDDGDLIPFDNANHLTQEGASFMGSKLGAIINEND